MVLVVDALVVHKCRAVHTCHDLTLTLSLFFFILEGFISFERAKLNYILTICIQLFVIGLVLRFPVLKKNGQWEFVLHFNLYRDGFKFSVDSSKLFLYSQYFALQNLGVEYIYM